MKLKLGTFFILLLLVAASFYGTTEEEPSSIRVLGFGADGGIHALTGGEYEKSGVYAENVLPSDHALFAVRHYHPSALFQTDAGVILSLENNGIRCQTSTGPWSECVHPPPKPVFFLKEGRRQITAISEDGKWALSKHKLLMKVGSRYVPVKTSFAWYKYLTAIFHEGNRLYVGTSTDGLYRAQNYNAANYFRLAKLGKAPTLRFKKVSSGLPKIPHSRNVAFYEEIRSISRHQNRLFVTTGIQGGIYVAPLSKLVFRAIEMPESLSVKKLGLDVYLVRAGAAPKEYYVSTSRGLYKMTLDQKSLRPDFELVYSAEELFPPDKSGIRLVGFFDSKGNLLGYARSIRPFISTQRKARMETSRGKKLFYSSAYNYRKRMKQVDSLLQKGPFDGMVMDVKDDQGYIRYKSSVPFAKKIRAVRPLVSLPAIAKKMKRWNKYFVVRLVVFKDPVLYRVPGYAILDARNRKPWVGAPGERWIDPYREDLAEDYYIPLVKELQEIGVDEIQLDYIRFPSDGSIHRTYYSHKKEPNMNLTDALENFLAKLRPQVQVPLSMDIYGYNGIYRAPGRIGQDVDVYLKYADVLCPMLYSSHFGDRYMTHGPKAERAYALLRHSAIRYLHLAKKEAVVRPYIQAFPMKNSIWGYGKKYFLDQIRGGTDLGVEGYTFWGAFEHIKRVAAAIRE